MIDTIKPALSRDAVGYILALGAIISMLLSTVLWFLKLDARYETLSKTVIVMESRLTRLEVKIDRGILPIAETRINNIVRDDQILQQKFEAFVEWHNQNFVPASGLQKDIDRLERRLKEIDDRYSGAKK